MRDFGPTRLKIKSWHSCGAGKLRNTELSNIIPILEFYALLNGNS